jgi:hypothetical protein
VARIPFEDTNLSDWTVGHQIAFIAGNHAAMESNPLTPDGVIRELAKVEQYATQALALTPAEWGNVAGLMKTVLRIKAPKSRLSRFLYLIRGRDLVRDFKAAVLEIGPTLANRNGQATDEAGSRTAPNRIAD